MQDQDVMTVDFFVVTRGGKYLAESGSENAWTTKAEKARRFRTMKEASDECCENESPARFGDRL